MNLYVVIIFIINMQVKMFYYTFKILFKYLTQKLNHCDIHKDDGKGEPLLKGSAII